MIQLFIFIASIAVFLTNVPLLFAEEKPQISSRFNCPQPNKVVLNWVAFPPIINGWNTTTKEPTGELPETLNTVYSNCCPSLSFSYSWLSANSSQDIEISIRRDKSSQLSLYFPVFSHTKVITQYQRPYIGLYYSPGPALIILDTGENNLLDNLVVTTKASWLILAAANGLAIIYGVIMWLLEKRKNAEEFPSDFPQGAGEGTWWAFVTMSTVGYGDKAPRTCSGRVLAVVWMYVSTIVLSMYTANLSANMTISYRNEVTAQGKKVGVSLGSKSFFKHEMNLGAKFKELSFQGVEKELNRPTLDAYLIYDYVEAQAYQYKQSQNSSYGGTTFQPLRKWKVGKIYDVPFSIGISAAGNVTGSLNKFLQCLQREVVDVISVSKYERIRSWEEIEEMIKESPTNNSWLPRLFTVGLIYLVATVLLVGGGLWQKLKRTQGNRVSNGEEGQP